MKQFSVLNVKTTLTRGNDMKSSIFPKLSEYVLPDSEQLLDKCLHDTRYLESLINTLLHDKAAKRILRHSEVTDYGRKEHDETILPFCR